MRGLISGVVGVIAIFLVAPLCLVSTSMGDIIDVGIVPAEPRLTDEITIFASGVESTGPVFVDNSVLDRDGLSLTLDLYLNVGFADILTPWSHSHFIGTLPMGSYELTVRTFENTIVTDTHSLAFEVAPEPGTVLLFAAGAVGIRAHQRKKNRS